MSNECFVAAEGVLHSDLYCGLGTINSHCRVNHWGFNNDDPESSWNNNLWRSYSSTAKNTQDEAINLMFKYDNIGAGSTVQFNYAYVLGPDDLPVAMNDLSFVTITNPTDIVSGGNALFKSLIDQAALTVVGGTDKTITSIVYYLYAICDPSASSADCSGSTTAPEWHTLKTFNSGSTPAVVAGTLQYSHYFNANAFLNGRGQTKAVYTLSDSSTYEANIGTEIVDSGLEMCWDLNNDDTSDGFLTSIQAMNDATNSISLVPCSGTSVADANLITQIRFFRIIVLPGTSGEIRETNIATLSNQADRTYGPVTIPVDDLYEGVEFSIEARISHSGGADVATILEVKIAEENNVPSDITLSASTLSEGQGSGTGTVGLLGVVDDNSGQSYTYAITNPSPSPYFSISGTTLQFDQTIDFETVFSGSTAASATTPITVRVTDNGIPSASYSKTFSLTVNNMNEAPSGVDQTTFTVPETQPTDSGSDANVIHTFAVSDPDNGQSHTCSLVGAGAYFEVDPSTCKLRVVNSLDYETAAQHSFTLNVQDNGWGTMGALSSSFNIIVNVQNVNEAPAAVGIYGGLCGTSTVCTFPETAATAPPSGTAEGATIGTLKAIDPECAGDNTMVTPTECVAAGRALDETISFTISNNPGNHFEIVGDNTLKIRSGGAVDYEALASGTISVTIRVTDAAGLTKSQVITMVIQDVAEPPSANSLTCYVPEATAVNQIAGSTTAGAGGDICMVQATAAGEEELEYSITGGNSEGKFSIQDCSGIIFVEGDLEYDGSDSSQWSGDANHQYSLTVTITGAGDATITTTVIMNILPVNEAPVFSDFAASVAENAAVTSVIALDGGGSIASRVSDPDAGDTTLYAITGGNGDNKFAIDENSGVITLQNTVDYESLASESYTYVLTVQVSDSGGLSDTATFTVTITDSDEPPTFPAQNGIFATVYEVGASQGSAVDDNVGARLIASDQDAGSTAAYTISAGNNNDAFKISTAQDTSGDFNYYYGQLQVKTPSAFDFEDAAKNSFTLTILATDNTGLTDSVQVTINVLNANEAPVLVPQTFSVLESAAAGDQVGTNLLENASDDEGDDITFSVTSRGADSSGMTFNVAEDTGAVTIAAGRSLDHETVGQYTYTIQVSDPSGATSTASLTINVGDVEEAPTFTNAPDGEVDENMGANALVGLGAQPLTYSVADDDVGDEVTFTIVDVDGATSQTIFAVERIGVSNNYNIKALNSLNYEAKNSYAVKLRAQDNSPGSLFVERTVEVEVNNKNDLPTLADGNCFVSSGASSGTMVCQLTGSDQDSSSNPWGTLTYGSLAITGCSKGGVDCLATANGKFTLEGGGALKTAGAVNDLELASITVTAVVSDGADPAGTDTGTFTISVTETDDLPLCGNIGTLLVPENSVAGVLVKDGSDNSLIDGTNKIHDTDTPVPDPFLLSITAGDTEGKFAIAGTNTDSTLVTTSNTLDFETTPVFNLNIRITSQTGLQHIVDCPVTVNVVDVNEPTTFDDFTMAADENLAAGAELSAAGGSSLTVRPLVIDPDAADQGGTFSLVAPFPTPDPIAIDSTTGVLSVKAGFTLDHEAKDSFAYVVRWVSPRPSGGSTETAAMTLNINDLPEPPVVAATTFTTSEGQTGIVGTVVATDPDFPNYSPCNGNCGLKYSLGVWDAVTGNTCTGTDQFCIDENTGVLSLNQAQDFESVGFVDVAVTVKDTNGLGLSHTATVRVNIADVNDCTISNIYDKSASTSHFNTTGGETLYIYGADLGPVMTKDGSGNWQPERVGGQPADADINVGVVMKDSSNDLVANSLTLSNCGIVRDIATDLNLATPVIKCTTPAGVGGNFKAIISVASPYGGTVGTVGTTTCATTYGQATNQPYFAYSDPEITAVEVSGDGTIPTAGATDGVTITGKNFGPVGTTVNAVYQNSNGQGPYSAPCEFLVAHTKVKCTTRPGLGANHIWRIQVGGLLSEGFGTPSSYTLPNVASLQLRNAATDEVMDLLDANTAGGDRVIVTGTNFGVIGTVATVTYGNNQQFQPGGQPYTATNCAVTTDHTTIACDTVPGVGIDLFFRVTVGGQTSVESGTPPMINYHIPAITNVAGPGSYRASSEGGQRIYLTGSMFGPSQVDNDYSYLSVTYGPTGSEYTAANCEIITAHTYVRCDTGPGTGKDHIWKISVNGRVSASYAAMTSYAPPIVAYYEGPGSNNADTRGNQVVTIHGRNFGTLESKITMVRYNGFDEDGASTTVFEVTDTCEIANDHTKLTCDTKTGAGGDLHWSVIVDSQLSESPKTNYLSPRITSITGAGVMASNYGGQDITITGDYFGPNTTYATSIYGSDFLDYARYGATVTDENSAYYEATNCVVNSHTQIVCQTAEGVGANLHWSIAVAAQLSDASDGVDPNTLVTSYSPPVINDPNPILYSTAGNVQVTLTGSNLGCIAGASPTVQFGTTNIQAFPQGQDILTFMLPESEGVNIPVVLTVGGQQSNTRLFSYLAPHIESVHSQQDPSADYVTIIILGESFSRTPEVYLQPTGSGDEPPSLPPLQCTNVFDNAAGIPTLSHSEIHCQAQVYQGSLWVVVGDRESNRVPFETGDPVVIYSSLNNGYNSNTESPTSGGGVLEILCQYCGEDPNALEVTIGAGPLKADCVVDKSKYGQVSDTATCSSWGGAGGDANVEPSCTWSLFTSKISVSFNADEFIQQIFCQVPQGQDVNNDVIVRKNGVVSSLGCSSELSTSAPCFDYDAPVLDSMSAQADGTAGGSSVTIEGKNFGLNQTVRYGRYDLDISSSSHTQIVGTFPEGVGKDMDVVIAVGSQTTPLNANTLKFSYNRPEFTPSSVEALNLNTGVTDTLGSCNVDGVNGCQAVTLTGANFGDQSVFGDIYGKSGPVLRFGDDVVDVTSFDHAKIVFNVPAGQGANLPITVNVTDQVNVPGATFTYQPPRITSTFPLVLETDTQGGKVTGEKITITGTNFGVVDKSWSIVLDGENVGETDVVVQPEDIFLWTHTKIVFYVPEGQGRNKALMLTVGGQAAVSDETPETCGGRTAIACFSYKPPIVYGLNPVAFADTQGGYPITLVGTSFGVNGAAITISDKKFEPGHPIDGTRMGKIVNSNGVVTRETNCEIVSQHHTEVVCTAPEGLGSNLEVKMELEGVSNTNATFSYAAPVLKFVVGSKSGDASGGEELRIYGDNFGPWRTPVNLTVGENKCENGFWTNDDAMFDFEPYIKCPVTGRSFVGQKDVQVDVAFSSSGVFERFAVECKIGTYGRLGEYCAECGEPLETGYVCDEDGLELPHSYDGWWRIMQDTDDPNDSRYCHPEMTTNVNASWQRTECPSMWPCMPTFACLGNNTCEVMYSDESVRCSQCASGYFKLNGNCEECPSQPWLIPVTIAIVAACAGYIGHKLDKKQVNLGIITIGVDYFQVLAIFSSANVDWPPQLKAVYNYLSAFNLNIDLAAPECWQAADFTYDQKWTVVELTPVVLFGFALMLYMMKYLWKVFKGRKARLHSHAPKLFGSVITIFYYTYLYVTTKTLSVFNCQSTNPSDGFYYMTEVGTEDGLCYEEGTMQQALEPWAYLAFFLYTLGFPVFCGLLLWHYQKTCFLDQVLKAGRRTDEELKAAGTYKFRKMWHRLYHYYKPQYFFWIELVLFRKFMIAITALLFRNNTLFMLSMTLLVIIVSYAIQVKYSPYMSTAEYEGIISENSAMIDEVVSAKMMNLKLVQQQNQRSKAAKLGRMSLIEFSIKAPKMSFLHNYNTVESTLLFSAILVNLSGIMFESGQLSGAYLNALTFVIIMLVFFSLSYFAFVLSTELWVAFYPDKPFCWLKCLGKSGNDEEEDKTIRDSSLVFDTNPLAMADGVSKADGDKINYLETELNKMWGTVAEKDKMIKKYQEEIRQLKKNGGGNMKGAALQVLAANKKKKQFGQSSKDLVSSKRLTGTGPIKAPSNTNREAGGNVKDDAL